MGTVLKTFKKSALMTLSLVLICGIIYPLALTGVSKLFFPHQANGSLIEVDGQFVGSEVVGQNFTDPKFMKGRPSAVNYNTYTEADKLTGDYSGVGSGSNNYAPSNPALVERIQADMEAFLAANPEVKKEDIPTDLLTASGSGLDPHISPASALVQIPGLVKATGLTEETLKTIVDSSTTNKLLGVFGEQTVNVLKVNLEIAKAIGMID